MPKKYEEWSAFVADSTLLKFGLARGVVDSVCYVNSILGAIKFRWTWILPFLIWSAVAGFIDWMLSLQFCKEWEETDTGVAIADEWECSQPLAAHVFNWIMYGLFSIRMWH